MRTIALGIFVVGFTAVGGMHTVSAPKLNVLADSVTQDGDALRLHGHVRIATEGATVIADDAVMFEATREIELTGNVRMRLVDKIDPLSITKNK